MRIFKYPLQIKDAHSYQLPLNAKILSVGLDPTNCLCLWALVDPSPHAPRENRAVFIIGTGNPIPEEVEERLDRGDAKFLGTVRDGQFMWHVFID
jgi:hypothetical protein